MTDSPHWPTDIPDSERRVREAMDALITAVAEQNRELRVLCNALREAQRKLEAIIKDAKRNPYKPDPPNLYSFRVA